MAAIPTRSPSTGVLAYSVLACAITWLLAVPVAAAWIHRRVPPPAAVACAGLSAFGPLLAALVVAGRRGQLRALFGRWRTSPAWIGLALAGPFIAHTIARVADVAMGGQPARWLDAPRTPEALAALVVFPLGEELGWRGFAYPRLVDRLGPVRGPLVLGAIWGVWHLMYAVTPDAAGFDVREFAMTLIELPLYSLVLSWIFERANRSLAVAIAFHTGAHLDHLERAPRADLRLHILHMAVAGLLALAAAEALRRRTTLALTPLPQKGDSTG